MMSKCMKCREGWGDSEMGSVYNAPEPPRRHQSPTMKLLSKVQLLVVAQALALAAAAGTEVADEDANITTIAYTTTGTQPELFDVGDDNIEVNIKGCMHRNELFCCFNQPLPTDLSGARFCSVFASAQCCYMIPGQDQHPRLPADLVPLLPTLASPGQCEQRRRGRRVLHCCRGAEPRDPNPSGRAGRICSSVGELRCCYHPFAGHKLASIVSASKDDFNGVFAVKVTNHEGVRGDRIAYIKQKLRRLRLHAETLRDILE